MPQTYYEEFSYDCLKTKWRKNGGYDVRFNETRVPKNTIKNYWIWPRQENSLLKAVLSLTRLTLYYRMIEQLKEVAKPKMAFQAFTLYRSANPNPILIKSRRISSL